MVEYDVSKQEYPHFPLNSNELSYPTTYVLSRYSECVIENNHDELKRAGVTFDYNCRIL